MNDETRHLVVDRMIDEVATAPSGASRPITAHPSPPGPEEILVRQLRELGPVDWPADDVGDRIARRVAAAGITGPDVAMAPGGADRSRHGRRRRAGRLGATIVAVAAAVLVVVILLAPETKGPSGTGRLSTRVPVSTASLRMRLVDSTTSPFQSVGAGPQSGDLLCVTALVCYADETGGSSGVERTVDGGSSWQDTAPLPDNEQFTSWPLSCPTTDVCAGAASVDGSVPGGSPLQLAVTSDGGRRWTIRSLTPPPGMAGATIDQVSCATATQCVVYVLGQSGPAGPATGAFLVTTDGGDTWAPAGAVPSTAGGLFTLRCDPDGTCLGLAPTGSVQTPASEAMVALRSTDDGRSWTSTSSPLASGPGVILLSCGDTSDCMLAYPSTDGGAITMATTTDGGATWKVTAAPPNWPTVAVDLSCATAEDCFLSAASSTSGGGYQDPVIEATHDGGTTWNPLALPSVDGAALALVYPLSCPVGDGCIGVGATPQEFNGPVEVPKPVHGDRPAPGWVKVGGRVIISNLPASGGS